MAPLASRALDQRLPLRDRWRLAVHLLICRFCRQFSRQLRVLGEIVRLANSEHLADAVPHTLSPEARRRIVRQLTELG